ncbi:acetyl-CoA carboxylase biotin carboxyl carrier protein subunit [Parabacteroides sp. 52]|uniref:acetyl-CoA carboxylase biotin carboxyl carrier protein subunit n=1 Tax=unclassified Parabacteroides TaxID=2649774 RepID=UPI0013D1107C|nr:MULTISPECIES: acetyl-CoA carboxylase biotin carboxyl carrier protein subunit [unclassified Parabacteroides]MDH6533562.1 biotin carboxyl carrier protein [Parabacteroides sp. PM5-20]NDV54314.1 acetyl-CoA carboxylase biotin carboxyl carrier protein subunit [Parabacteroides sp. 52]
MEKKTNKYVDFAVIAGTYKTKLTTKYENRTVWHKPNPGDVLANLPGTIMKVEVKEGEQVKEGQLLLIHEAMKMLNRVVAPVSGTVTSVNVSVGDKIGKNHLMVKIDPQ